MKYYLITDCGVDGIMLEEMPDQQEAVLRFIEISKRTNVKDKYDIVDNYGVVLISGEVMLAKDFQDIGTVM